MILIQRYKTYISAIVLAAQISILGISVLHTHVRHIHEIKEISFSDKISSEHIADPFLDENGKCKIFEFVQSVSKFLISEPNYCLAPLNTKTVLRQNNQDFVQSSSKLVYGLRAPPVL
jgi:hypothetical protein